MLHKLTRHDTSEPSKPALAPIHTGDERIMGIRRTILTNVIARGSKAFSNITIPQLGDSLVCEVIIVAYRDGSGKR